MKRSFAWEEITTACNNLLSIHKFEAEYLYTMELHNIESRPLLVTPNELLLKSVELYHKNV